MLTVIIDYGMGNLGSIRRSFEECGAKVKISDEPVDLKTAGKIIIPGVGSFRDGMQNLEQRGWVQAIKSAALEDKTPILGVCLGMQLLADLGTEGGEKAGLGLISGRIEKFIAQNQNQRIPHIGWNEVVQSKSIPLFNHVTNGCDFYFVHSYHFKVTDKEDIAATTTYCGEFVSVVAKDNIFGVQFHPEKSQIAGFKLIRNFLGL